MSWGPDIFDIIEARYGFPKTPEAVETAETRMDEIVSAYYHANNGTFPKTVQVPEDIYAQLDRWTQSIARWTDGITLTRAIERINRERSVPLPLTREIVYRGFLGVAVKVIPGEEWAVI